MIRIQIVNLLAFLSIAIVGFNPAAVVAQSLSADVQRAVDKVVHMEMRRQKIVGASVGLISDAKIIYTQGYGYADAEKKVPFNSDTVINWASNSKPVMAVLAIRLAQENKLNLDKPIGNYLEQLPKHIRPITTRQLLCHQSGIPHYSNGEIIPDEGFENPLGEHDPVNAIKRFIRSPLIFEPGSKESYSSYAYVLLSAVVQAAGEQPIASLLASYITDPLGMKSFQLDVPYEDQENWSKPYRMSNGKPIELPDQANFWKHGAGGYKSNVMDFAKFANSFINVELLDRRSTVAMMTPQSTSDGKNTNRGLGLIVSGSGKSLKISHGGSQPETRTRMVVYPNQRHGIVVMCNGWSAEPGSISTAIYKALKELRR